VGSTGRYVWDDLHSTGVEVVAKLVEDLLPGTLIAAVDQAEDSEKNYHQWFDGAPPSLPV